MRYRQACNYVAAYIDKTHILGLKPLNEALYYMLRDKFGLKAQMAQSVLKTVVARYKTILKNQKEWIRPEFKVPQLDLVWNRDYSLSKDVFSVNTLAGRVKMGYFPYGMEAYFNKDIYKFGTAKLVWRHGKFYLHIPVTFDAPECSDEDIRRVVGVDRGINFVVATYDDDGKSTFVNGRPIKQKRAKYAAVRKSLQKRKTPSARRRLKKIGSRENRWMRDVNHCVSKALVNSNLAHALFVLEDLTGIRSATERVRTKHRYVSVSWAFYLFQCKKCGYSSNDDRIGGMNLHQMGISYLSTRCSCG